jgi:hypothetical protein
MGGGFPLITLLSLFENARIMTRPYDKSDVQYLRQSSVALAISLLAVIAGIAIHKFQWWSLPLAGGMGIDNRILHSTSRFRPFAGGYVYDFAAHGGNSHLGVSACDMVGI